MVYGIDAGSKSVTAVFGMVVLSQEFPPFQCTVTLKHVGRLVSMLMVNQNMSYMVHTDVMFKVVHPYPSWQNKGSSVLSLSRTPCHSMHFGLKQAQRLRG